MKQHHPETEAAHYAEAEKRREEKWERDPLVKALRLRDLRLRLRDLGNASTVMIGCRIIGDRRTDAEE